MGAGIVGRRHRLERYQEIECPATIKMVMRDNQDGKVVAGLAA